MVCRFIGILGTNERRVLNFIGLMSGNLVGCVIAFVQIDKVLMYTFDTYCDYTSAVLCCIWVMWIIGYVFGTKRSESLMEGSHNSRNGKP